MLIQCFRHEFRVVGGSAGAGGRSIGKWLSMGNYEAVDRLDEIQMAGSGSNMVAILRGESRKLWSWREELNHPTVAGSARILPRGSCGGGQPPRTLPTKGTHPLRNP